MIQVFRLASIFILAQASFGCGSRANQDVYDFVAEKIIKSKSVLVVASLSDSRWFNENTVESVIVSGTKSHGTEPPWLRDEHIPLLRLLFERNAMDGTLAWVPSDQRVRLIAGEFRAKPSAEESSSMCFSEEAQPPIGVAESPNHALRIRPYHSLSRVAVSDDGQFAMLKIAYACAPLSGAYESIVFLKKAGDSWIFESGRRLWVS